MIFKRASVNDIKRIFEHIRDKFSEISSGAASTLLGQNLTAGKVLVSNADGKVSESEIDANEVTYFYGSSDEVNAALENLEVGTNIYCENDTEFDQGFNITEDRAVITNADGELSPSDVTATELGYLSGATDNVQEQIDEINSAMGNMFYRIDVGGDKKAKILFAGKHAVIVICNSTVGLGYLTLISQGYGVSTIRTHVAEIMKGDYFSYEVLQDEYGILITNTLPSGAGYSLSIFIIEGFLVGVEKI